MTHFVFKCNKEDYFTLSQLSDLIDLWLSTGMNLHLYLLEETWSPQYNQKGFHSSLKLYFHIIHTEVILSFLSCHDAFLKDACACSSDFKHLPTNLEFQMMNKGLVCSFTEECGRGLDVLWKRWFAFERIDMVWHTRATIQWVYHVLSKLTGLVYTCFDQVSTACAFQSALYTLRYLFEEVWFCSHLFHVKHILQVWDCEDYRELQARAHPGKYVILYWGTSWDYLTIIHDLTGNAMACIYGYSKENHYVTHSRTKKIFL